MPKWAKRADGSQSQIVSALRNAGFQVHIIGRPVDLLIWHPSFGRGVFKAIEVKTPTKTGKRRNRKDQEAQDEFIRATGTPYAMTTEEALHAVGIAYSGEGM